MGQPLHKSVCSWDVELMRFIDNIAIAQQECTDLCNACTAYLSRLDIEIEEFESRMREIRENQ